MGRKSYPIKLGCAACAAKMERKIAGLPGVSACEISFMTGRISLECEEERREEILEEAQRIVRRIEPGAVIGR